MVRFVAEITGQAWSFQIVTSSSSSYEDITGCAEKVEMKARKTLGDLVEWPGFGAR